MLILGLSAYYHDSAAALIRDGEIVAAAQEERFTRSKHDARFPTNAIAYCLREAHITLADVDYVVFYIKPVIEFERLLETHLTYAARGFRSLLSAMPIWLKEKLSLKAMLKKELARQSGLSERALPQVLFTEHNQAHAASAFFPSPFQNAAVLCLDGVGERSTNGVWLGANNTLTPQWQIDFPHSLGLLYSAFTYYTGLKLNSGEYQLMGLAPYGEPKYVDLIFNHLLDLKDDGTFRLDMRYFNYSAGSMMTNQKLADLFGAPARQSDSPITQREMDIAASIQIVTEEVVLKLARTAQRELQQDNLCLAGAIASNCAGNGRLLREGPFKNIWIQPATGDAGGALGAAFSVWYEHLGNARSAPDSMDSASDLMRGSYLGPWFSSEGILDYLDDIKAPYKKLDDEAFYSELSTALADQKVVGWFQGRMELGPRALGARSILGDPRSEKMQAVINMKIKGREALRPFSPAIKVDRVGEWFEHQGHSPYMQIAAPLRADKRIAMTATQQKLFGVENRTMPRSQIPAVTQVDYSARVQTVHAETNPRFYQLLDHFEQKTGCPMLVNTSFNMSGEPIVCTPEDAYRCFMHSDIDCLVLENIILYKHEQPLWEGSENWQNGFEVARKHVN